MTWDQGDDVDDDDGDDGDNNNNNGGSGCEDCIHSVVMLVIYLSPRITDLGLKLLAGRLGEGKDVNALTCVTCDA